MNADLDGGLNVPSIDLFVTFRCGLRCSPCFVGENLDAHSDMDLASLGTLLRTAHTWRTTKITFLGGEPTLHPQFSDALQLATDEGYAIRVVTNGHLSYQRFLKVNGRTRPLNCFSVDGSTAEVHDRIRGTGSFSILLDSIERSIAGGYRVGAIVALSRDNARDVPGILALCHRYNFEYVNIHYVTNRGFAKAASVLSIDEWHETCATIRGVAVGPFSV